MSERTYRFQGRTVAEAMRKLTEALGPDAVIIDRRRLKGKHGMLGGLLGGEERVEIIGMAATEAPPAPPPAPAGSLLAKVYRNAAGSAPATAFAPALAGSTPTAAVALEPVPAEVRSSASDSALYGARACEHEQPSLDRRTAAGLGELHTELESIRHEMRLWRSVQARGGAPGVADERLLDAYQRLVENDVATDIAGDLVERMQSECVAARDAAPDQIEASLCDAIAGMMPVAGPIALAPDRPTVVALVGPTGVGKTTTLIKLAFDFVVRQGRTVGLVTEDVHRPGAEAQLRNLAHLLGLTVVEADVPSRAREEIDRLRERDLVLIDTAGRVPRDTAAVAGLADFLEAARPEETHLVLSSECAERSALETIERFRPVGFDRIVFSKLDEAASYGLLLNVAAKVRERISYVTTGQEYAETITPGEGRMLARLVAGMERVETPCLVAAQ